jgi:hypothetical protein
MSLDGLKPSQMMDTVRFESEPPGAEAKTSTGQTCRTPCALALPVNAPVTVTFTLAGYQPESESIEPIAVTGSPTQLRPNPVTVELSPAPPQAKPTKKPPVAKKKAAAPKAAARPRPATAAPAAGAPAAPAQQPAAAPWPAPTPR